MILRLSRPTTGNWPKNGVCDSSETSRASWIVALTLARKKATAKRFKQMEGTLADKVSRQEMDKALVGHEAKCHSHRRQTGALEAALGKLQTDVGHLPSRHEIQGLNDSITSLGKEMGKLEGRLDGINRAVDLVNEFLINQGGKQ